MEYKNLYLIRKLEESNQYYNRSFSNRYMNWKRCYSIIKSLRQKLKKLNLKEKSIKILDVGCGDGWFICRLKSEFDKEYPLEFTGIDISELDIEFANYRKEYFQQQNCYFQVTAAQNLGFDNGSFDIVISSELMEHIPGPDEVIREVHRVLKKDGLFILTTPHKGGGLLARFSRLMKGIIDTHKEESKPDFIEEKEISKMRLSSDQGLTGAGLGHISVKSPKEWVEILRKEGFRIISIKGTSGLLFGSPRLDNYRILFALTVILDVFLEKLPLSYLWAETSIFELRKC